MIHAKEGMYLEHLWQNADDVNEMQFLFRTDDLRACTFVEATHARAKKEHQEANLPEMLFLKD